MGYPDPALPGRARVQVPEEDRLAGLDVEDLHDVDGIAPAAPAHDELVGTVGDHAAGFDRAAGSPLRSALRREGASGPRAGSQTHLEQLAVRGVASIDPARRRGPWARRV